MAYGKTELLKGLLALNFFMDYLKVAVLVFLLIGLFMVYQDTQKAEESFVKGSWTWFKQLWGNTKSVTGFAVQEHDWLPMNVTEDS